MYIMNILMVLENVNFKLIMKMNENLIINVNKMIIMIYVEMIKLF
jgi:hypothetical protein